jgi:hypothetical protein
MSSIWIQFPLRLITLLAKQDPVVLQSLKLRTLNSFLAASHHHEKSRQRRTCTHKNISLVNNQNWSPAALVSTARFPLGASHVSDDYWEETRDLKVGLEAGGGPGVGDHVQSPRIH